MNFELKSLDLAGAASEKSDALLVLVTTAYKPGRGVLADLIAHAVKAGDLDTKAGKLLHAYRSAGVASPRPPAPFLLRWLRSRRAMSNV